ncbi:MAG: DUF4491 family protein [Peptococcaceae bacterium]|nr:DUF4491 family protein [Peptococcaceae bacterium]
MSSRREKTTNLQGIFLGAISFLIIGVWHPIVIKGEYYLGKKICMPIFAAIGVFCVAKSMRIKSTILHASMALFGFSALWGILEVQEQEERVQKGWFPANPKRVAKKAQKMQAAQQAASAETL